MDRSRHHSRQRSLFAVTLISILVGVICSSHGSHAADIDAEFFERRIRPLLIDKCVGCHGSEEQSGGLRLDSADALARGGDNGPVLVAGNLQASKLIRAVRRDGDLVMPPEQPLSEPEVAAIERWVRSGARWPKKSAPLTPPSQKKHWAFQPVGNPDVPPLADDWGTTEIDAFILAALRSSGLSPSAKADRRTLIRRATFDLTGLPPKHADVEAFVADDDPQAWPRLVDRLLNSKHYGEKWARHWLDVARYSDTKGYVYGREERHWVHAWTYRDWVARAINDDMPYDRFLLLQLAADQMDVPRGDLAAMGFLTIGRRFLGVTHDIIDDRIDVVTRGTMGLTVACARCHDHKYDPIPTEDYYALYGVFRNGVEKLVSLADISDQDSEFAKGLVKRETEYAKTMQKWRDEAAARVRGRIHDYLLAQLELDKYPEQGFDQFFVESDMMPEFVRRWRDYLDRARKNQDRIFSAWRMFQELPATQFGRRAAAVCEQIQAMDADALHPSVKAIFVASPASIEQVIVRYAELFTRVCEQHDDASDAEEVDGDQQELIDLLYGPHSPCVVPDEPIVSTERCFPTSQCEKLWKLRGEVDRWLMKSAEAPPQALLLTDSPLTADTRVLKRGNPALLGEVVPRRFLTLLGGLDEHPFRTGSGRMELARAIVDPDNPLTARVAVNRVWMHHFGHGLVETPSDFGRRAGPPSHPRLLDWLARYFIKHGWRAKKLHRLIMLSDVYQQRSSVVRDSERLITAQQKDPQNLLFWRMNPRRLSFEEMRDAMLLASGLLNDRVGGKPVILFNSNRRSLYGNIDRQFFDAVLRVFDVANPDLHTPKRTETTVPQQALFLMNHPFTIQQAVAISKSSEADDGKLRVHNIYRSVLQRVPSNREVNAALKLVRQAEAEIADAKPENRPTQWQYGYGRYDETQQKVIDFQPLPYFDGTAWQGGPKYPDSSLGWLQLTATGGHPGNDKNHAVVRRWTAPKDLQVIIESNLKHEPKVGDGIRVFLLGAGHGLIQHADVHTRSQEFNSQRLDLKAGDTVDFVVDLRDDLNSEQFLWEATITCVDRPGQKWNSRTDFSGPRVEPLEPWAQLAQVLLLTNEFVFVD